MFIDERSFHSETSISTFSQEMLHILSSHGDRVHLAVPDVGRELPEDHEAAVDPGGDVTSLPGPCSGLEVGVDHLEVLLPLAVHPVLLVHVQVLPCEHRHCKYLI